MRACKVCKTRFEGKGFIVWCSHECGAKIALARLEKKRQAQAKAERKTDKAKLRDMKPLSYWNGLAQEAFNRYVRLRDIKAGHGCIDCGKPFEPNTIGGSVDAGHYISRGSAKHLRFDERNCFAQRKNCNRPGGTTRDAFRAGVVSRIGLSAVEALESDNEPRQYRRHDLEQIIQTYRAKTRELEKQP